MIEACRKFFVAVEALGVAVEQAIKSDLERLRRRLDRHPFLLDLIDTLTTPWDKPLPTRRVRKAEVWVTDEFDQEIAAGVSVEHTRHPEFGIGIVASIEDWGPHGAGSVRVNWESGARSDFVLEPGTSTVRSLQVRRLVNG